MCLVTVPCLCHSCNHIYFFFLFLTTKIVHIFKYGIFCIFLNVFLKHTIKIIIIIIVVLKLTEKKNAYNRIKQGLLISGPLSAKFREILIEILQV